MLTTDVSPSGAGTLSVSSGWQDSGTTVTATETAGAGYSFYYWTLDGQNVGNNSSYSVTMNAAHTLTAVFRGTSTISLASSPQSISVGGSVTLSGTLTPEMASTRVTLSYSIDNGATWNDFITTRTDNTGAYSVVWYPPYPNTYQLVATWNGNQNLEGSTSSPFSLTVTGPSPPTITLLVSGPASMGRGSQVTFDVLITNPGTATSTTIYIEVIGPGGNIYFDTLEVSVDAATTARFQFVWYVPSNALTGTYRVSVGFIPPEPAAVSQTQVTIA